MIGCRIALAITAVALTAGSACTTSGDQRAARKTYNQALADYRNDDWQGASEDFLAARDSAGVDPELRYRAAFNLAMSDAKHADSVAGEQAQEALDLLNHSAGWFRDAIRLRPDDDDARVNLEVVLRRAQILSDQLNAGKNRLEARLDRVIEDQRSLLVSVRRLLGRIATTGNSADPVGFEAEFDALATFERTLLADTGIITELGAGERGLIEGRGEEERSDEDKMRLYQLSSLELHLTTARTAMADSRRLLRRLQGDKAHRRANAALADLKRAREQLLDPVTVLKAIASDQAMLLQHTGVLTELRKGSISLAGAEPMAPPPWLDGEHLRDREANVGARASEILARFSAASGASADAEAGDPRQQRMLVAAGEAVPLLETAVAAMDSAAAALLSEQLEGAAREQVAALAALLRAIEMFSEIRGLIELAYADQSKVVALLTPPGAEGSDPTLTELTTEERSRQIREASARNRERLGRLQGLFSDEVAMIEEQAASAPPADPNDPDAAEAAEAAAAETEAAKLKFHIAEQHRQLALGALDRLDASLASARPETPALVPAQETLDELEELRRIFYSLIEHLKELHGNQTKSHDDTASVHDIDDDSQRQAQLGPIADFQTRHISIADQIAAALAEQADASAANPQQQGQDPEAGARLAEAATEVGDASAAMTAALAGLGEARDPTMSHDLQPILDEQSLAIEHLANAIRLLEPPEDDKQEPQEQDSEEQVSQQQAKRRLQDIREREAERKRERRHNTPPPDPVEKDW